MRIARFKLLAMQDDALLCPFDTAQSEESKVLTYMRADLLLMPPAQQAMGHGRTELQRMLTCQKYYSSESLWTKLLSHRHHLVQSAKRAPLAT